MGTNYSQGRYLVTDSNGSVIGRIDCDEFVRMGAKLLYRIDGDAVYDMSGELLGFIEDGAVKTSTGSRLLTISAE